MMRIILGLIAGVVAAFATVIAIQAVGQQIYPLSSELNLRDPEQMAGVIRAMPTGAMLFVVLAWFSAALVGGIVAKLVTRRVWAAWAIAGVIAVAAIMNILAFPHPVWMQLAAVVAPLLGGLAAAHLGPSPAATVASDPVITDPAV